MGADIKQMVYSKRMVPVTGVFRPQDNDGKS